MKTVQKAANIAVQAGSRLYTDSVSSYRAVKGYVHEFVYHIAGHGQPARRILALKRVFKMPIFLLLEIFSLSNPRGVSHDDQQIR